MWFIRRKGKSVILYLKIIFVFLFLKSMVQFYLIVKNEFPTTHNRGDYVGNFLTNLLFAIWALCLIF